MSDLIIDKKICFLTTVFPMPIVYLYDFFDSLDKQDYKIFDVVVVNDGNQDLYDVIQRFQQLNIYVIPAGKSPINNRERLIQFALDNNYQITVFGDSDDKFSSNRVSVAVDKLNRVDIVVNELSTFDSSGLLQSNYLSNRIIEDSSIMFKDIISHNIFGLSNTAVNTSILKNLPFPFEEKLVALDWYIFSLLLLQNCSAIFTSKSKTLYRQHDSNLVGIGGLNLDLIKNAISVKIKHYEAISPYYEKGKELKDNLTNLQYNNCKLNALLTKLQENQKFPLWWEL